VVLDCTLQGYEAPPLHSPIFFSTRGLRVLDICDKLGLNIKLFNRIWNTDYGL